MKGFSLAEALSHNARRKNTNPTRLIVSSFLAVILCGTLLLMLPQLPPVLLPIIIR